MQTLLKRKGLVAAFLAGSAMTGFLGVLAWLSVGTVPEGNRDFFNMGLVALIGFVSTAFGFYLGSSEGSARKNDLLAPPPAPPSSGEAGFACWSLVAALLGFSLIVLQFGCAISSDQRAGLATKALLGTQAAVVGIAQAADDLCSAGTLHQGQCDQVRETYEQAALTYDLAAGLLAAAVAEDSPDAWQNYRALHERFMGLYVDLTNLAIAFDLIPVIEGGAR